jgi:hypothetical protein
MNETAFHSGKQAETEHSEKASHDPIGRRLEHAQEKGWVHGLESQRFQLLDTAGEVDQEHLHATSESLHHGVGRGEHLDGADVRDEPAAGTQRGETGFEQAGHFTAVAADEDGVRGRQNVSAFATMRW